jgi:hypothetical protein
MGNVLWKYEMGSGNVMWDVYVHPNNQYRTVS